MTVVPQPADGEGSAIGAPGLLLGGKYRLEQAIARGGMARVWRARHVTLNRPVAVKFVEGAGEGQERIDRFLREAKVAASVRHKNVVDILDFGVFDNHASDNHSGDAEGRHAEPYMVMELLEGETLGELVERGPMELRDVVDIALQLLSGLDAVHRAGIVHRDLKPGNVFLTHDNDGTFARLLDFGISQEADEAEASTLIVGTPEYMAPEQAMGLPLDTRADLYSMGVLLYEMLSGRVPFEHEDNRQVLEMVVADTPIALATLRPEAPELAAVVEVAMSRDPDARYQTARDMRHAILDAAGIADTTERTSLARDLRPSGTRRREDLTTLPELAPALLEGDGPSSPALLVGEAPRSADRRWVAAAGALAVGLVIAVGVIWMQSTAPTSAGLATVVVSEPEASAALAGPPAGLDLADEAANDDVPSDEASDEVASDEIVEEVAAPGLDESDEAELAVDESAVIDEEAAAAPSETSHRARRRRRVRHEAEGSAEDLPAEAPAEVAPPRAVVTDLDF